MRNVFIILRRWKDKEKIMFGPYEYILESSSNKNLNGSVHVPIIYAYRYMDLHE